MARHCKYQHQSDKSDCSLQDSKSVDDWMFKAFRWKNNSDWTWPEMVLPQILMNEYRRGTGITIW